MMPVKPLTGRQERCLLALLAIEESDGFQNHRNAGAVARQLGFQHGPIQHGNGAKSRRSFSGTGAMGKWTYGALRGLEDRGLVYGYYAPAARIKSYHLLPEGRSRAIELRERGVAMADPDAGKAEAY